MDIKDPWFQIPRSGFLEFASEFTHHFHGEDASKNISVNKAYEFIDSFTKKHFMDYDESIKE